MYGTKAKGVISVQPDMMVVSEFDAFSGDMKLSDEDADMWFMEYYQVSAVIIRIILNICSHYGMRSALISIII